MSGEKRTKNFTFRMSESEYELAQEECGDDISLSELCRRAIFESKIVKLKIKNEQLDLAKLHVIAPIGNNINQLARAINTANLDGSVNDVLAATIIKQLEDIYNLINFEISIEKDSFLDTTNKDVKK